MVLIKYLAKIFLPKNIPSNGVFMLVVDGDAQHVGPPSLVLYHCWDLATVKAFTYSTSQSLGTF